MCKAHGNTHVKEEGTFKALLAYRGTNTMYGGGSGGNCTNSTGDSDSAAGRAGGNGDMVMARRII